MHNFDGKKLKELLEKINIKTTDFSKKADVDRSQLLFAIQGYRPSDTVINKICDYFKVPYDYFDQVEDNPTTLDLQKRIKESEKKLVAISAESDVSEATIRRILNSTSYLPSDKIIGKLNSALDEKEETPLTKIELKVKSFADEEFGGDIEKAKEYIFRFYFDLKGKNI